MVVVTVTVTVRGLGVFPAAELVNRSLRIYDGLLLPPRWSRVLCCSVAFIPRDWIIYRINWHRLFLDVGKHESKTQKVM